MARSKTSSFITEIPLIVDSQQEKELLSRFQAVRQLYNACLNEAETRMNLVRKSDAYQQAKQIPRTQKKKRTEAFATAGKAYRFSEYELHTYSTITSKNAKWIAQKIDSNTQQTIATRAFKSVERVILGKAKKVRYKVPSRFRSVEGKTNKQGIRWKDNQLVWGNLFIKPLIDWTNPVMLHGLNSPIKYVRLLWREMNGVRRWYVQLVNEGMPYQKHQNYVSDGIVGIDLNISNIAFVGDNQAGLLPFARGVPTFEKEIKNIQRQMDRSSRANNPDNYHPDFAAKKGRNFVRKKGKNKKGKRKCHNSKRDRKLSIKRRELERRKTAYAKSQNRQIVNEILRHGKHIKTENVSVKGWQKRYGKAIAGKSPGFVQSELKRKAESASGSFTKFSTQKTALSQTHLNGNRIKKSLSQRVHYDQTGIVMHRDLFSAYLSRYVNDEDNLLLHLAQSEWERTEPFLMQAWKACPEHSRREFQTNCEPVGASKSRLSHSPSEQFCMELGTVNQIAINGRKVNLNS